VLDVVEGPAGPVLVERARRAALLVVGTREHVGLRRLVAGSVSHYCLSHAECPVVAVAEKIRVRVGVPPLRRQQPTSMGPLL
jgi:nucleotide-binding universal stress UspA family protein